MLRAARPRDRFVAGSALLLIGLGIYAWIVGGFGIDGLVGARRMQNLQRFLAELRPYPLQGMDWDTGTAFRWASDLLRERGWEAVLQTLAISVAAIVLAGIAAALLSLPAARSFAAPEPFLPGPRPAGRFARTLWGLLVGATRLALIFVRSIPEYMWAFLFLALLGPTFWPAVLALAIHNSGVLGKLTAEVVENVERPTLEALRGLGAHRTQIALAGIFPLTVPRFLLFFFYRWETCVREATVLGMLGVVSLGYWIQDARARNHYDEMILFVLLGAILVLLGDLISALARWIVRRA